MSERAVLTLLLCGCALFGMALLAELHSATSDAPARNASAAHLPAPPAARPATRASNPAQLIATTLARPLFSPTRRPAPQEGSGAGIGIADMRLTGIVTAPEMRFAIFAATGAKPLIVKEGEEVSGWRIEAIMPDAVSVSGPGGAETLQPKSDRSLVRTSPAATAPVPGARFAGPVGLARTRFQRSPGFAGPARPIPPGVRR